MIKSKNTSQHTTPHTGGTTREPLSSPDDVAPATKVVIGRRLSLEETGFKVVRLLKRILVIPSDMLIMFNESYKLYLALT
jgi:hypothetical protein